MQGFFRVDGADLETGEDTYLILQARSSREAEIIARKQGLLIAAVRAASSADWGAAPAVKTSEPRSFVDRIVFESVHSSAPVTVASELPSMGTEDGQGTAVFSNAIEPAENPRTVSPTTNATAITGSETLPVVDAARVTHQLTTPAEGEQSSDIPPVSQPGASQAILEFAPESDSMVERQIEQDFEIASAGPAEMPTQPVAALEVATAPPALTPVEKAEAPAVALSLEVLEFTLSAHRTPPLDARSADTSSSAESESSDGLPSHSPNLELTEPQALISPAVESASEDIAPEMLSTFSVSEATAERPADLPAVERQDTNGELADRAPSNKPDLLTAALTFDPPAASPAAQPFFAEAPTLPESVASVAKSIVAELELPQDVQAIEDSGRITDGPAPTDAMSSGVAAFSGPPLSAQPLVTTEARPVLPEGKSNFAPVVPVPEFSDAVRQAPEMIRPPAFAAPRAQGIPPVIMVSSQRVFVVGAGTTKHGLQGARAVVPVAAAVPNSAPRVALPVAVTHQVAEKPAADVGSDISGPVGVPDVLPFLDAPPPPDISSVRSIESIAEPAPAIPASAPPTVQEVPVKAPAHESVFSDGPLSSTIASWVASRPSVESIKAAPGESAMAEVPGRSPAEEAMAGLADAVQEASSAPQADRAMPAALREPGLPHQVIEVEPAVMVASHEGQSEKSERLETSVPRVSAARPQPSRPIKVAVVPIRPSNAGRPGPSLGPGPRRQTMNPAETAPAPRPSNPAPRPEPAPGRPVGKSGSGLSRPAIGNTPPRPTPAGGAAGRPTLPPRPYPASVLSRRGLKLPPTIPPRRLPTPPETAPAAEPLDPPIMAEAVQPIAEAAPPAVPLPPEPAVQTAAAPSATEIQEIREAAATQIAREDASELSDSAPTVASDETVFWPQASDQIGAAASPLAELSEGADRHAHSELQEATDDSTPAAPTQEAESELAAQLATEPAAAAAAHAAPAQASLLAGLLAAVAFITTCGGCGIIIFALFRGTPARNAPVFERLDFRLQTLGFMGLGGMLLLVGMIGFIGAALIRVSNCVRRLAAARTR